MSIHVNSPLEGFALKPLKIFYVSPYLYSLTNSSLYMFLVLCLLIFVIVLAYTKWKIIPNTFHLLLIDLYTFIFSIVDQQIGIKGYKYFPFIFSLFIYILFSNLLGMTLYSFTTTSHLIITFGLSISIFIGVTILGFVYKKWKFLQEFVPTGVPSYLIPLLIVIEFFSYLSRPFSLGIRLFANMMSGHTLLIVLAGFTLKLFEKSFFFFIIPFLFIIILVGLELFVAFIQAYVFVLLVSIYISSSINEGGH